MVTYIYSKELYFAFPKNKDISYYQAGRSRKAGVFSLTYLLFLELKQFFIFFSFNIYYISLKYIIF